MSTVLAHAVTHSPIGLVHLAVSHGGAIVALGFDEQWAALTSRLAQHYGPLVFGRGANADAEKAKGAAVSALEAYFAGDLRALHALRVDAVASTFQRRVWSALRDIPPGTTRSYSAIALAVGAPRAVRAVGAANALNPVSIVVPCHRVIGQDGALRGYAGGIDRKQWLLAHENAFPTSRQADATSRAAVGQGECFSASAHRWALQARR